MENGGRCGGDRAEAISLNAKRLTTSICWLLHADMGPRFDACLHSRSRVVRTMAHPNARRLPITPFIARFSSSVQHTLIGGFFQSPASSHRNAIERVIRNSDGQSGRARQNGVDPGEKRASACHDDAASD